LHFGKRKDGGEAFSDINYSAILAAERSNRMQRSHCRVRQGKLGFIEYFVLCNLTPALALAEA